MKEEDGKKGPRKQVLESVIETLQFGFRSGYRIYRRGTYIPWFVKNNIFCGRKKKWHKKKASKIMFHRNNPLVGELKRSRKPDILRNRKPSSVSLERTFSHPCSSYRVDLLFSSFFSRFFHFLFSRPDERFLLQIPFEFQEKKIFVRNN